MSGVNRISENRVSVEFPGIDAGRSAEKTALDPTRLPKPGPQQPINPNPTSADFSEVLEDAVSGFDEATTAALLRGPRRDIDGGAGTDHEISEVNAGKTRHAAFTRPAAVDSQPELSGSFNRLSGGGQAQPFNYADHVANLRKRKASSEGADDTRSAKAQNLEASTAVKQQNSPEKTEATPSAPAATSFAKKEKPGVIASSMCAQEAGKISHILKNSILFQRQPQAVV